MERELLLLPGPTPLPPEVRRALTRDVTNHRGPTFSALVQRVQGKLQQVFQTAGEVLVLPAAGTGGLEAGVVNFFSPGDRVLAVSTGAFGERFGKIAAAYGLDVQWLRYEWGRAFDPDEVVRRIQEDPSIRGVLVTHNETSTGVTNPVAELARKRGEGGPLLLVDAVSSLGAIPLPMDELGLDVVITGAQKGLMTPPGLAFLAVGPRAWAAYERARLPKFYFDLGTYRGGNLPYTPAVSLWYGLEAALDWLLAEGLEKVYARHRVLGEMTRAGGQALGLRLLADPAYASATVTAFFPPEGVDADRVRGELRQWRITVAGGQGALRGKIFRVGHVGYVFPEDVLTLLSVLEDVLPRLGAEVTPGRATAAAAAAQGR